MGLFIYYSLYVFLTSQLKRGKSWKWNEMKQMKVISECYCILYKTQFATLWNLVLPLYQVSILRQTRRTATYSSADFSSIILQIHILYSLFADILFSSFHFIFFFSFGRLADVIVWSLFFARDWFVILLCDGLVMRKSHKNKQKRFSCFLCKQTMSDSIGELIWCAELGGSLTVQTASLSRPFPLSGRFPASQDTGCPAPH